MIAPEVGNNEHQRYVFVADEVVFQILHPPIIDEESAATLRTQIIAAINNFLRPGGTEIGVQLPDNDWRNRLLPLAFGVNLRIVTFSSPTQLKGTERFSLIPIKLIGHAQDDLTPDDVISLLKDAYTDLRGSFIVPGGGGDDDGEEGDDEDDDDERDDKENGKEKRNKLQPIPLNDAGDISLKSISPNWLASDLHHGGATGGPGSLPASKPVPSAAERQFHLEGAIDRLTDYRRPGAQIAILDTAIPLFRIENNETLANFPPDIMAMFLANPGMEVLLYPYPDLSPLGQYAQSPHHYEMADHGTFIASIIRAITPGAKIYLRQVLNSFGVGSFISVAQGVVDAVSQIGNNTPPLIINCSFMLDDNLRDLDVEIANLRQWPTRRLLRTSMRDVFIWATTTSNQDVIVVASAGNDSAEGNRRAARYPAAFSKVVSVAALPKNNPKLNGRYRPASYSNRAHSNQTSKDRAYSIATFGGELMDGTSAPEAGVLGVYIGEIPTQVADGSFLQDPPPNATAWAEWSGTSFSAPIITGLLAAPNSSPVISAAASSGTDQTVDDEYVILVQQG